MTRTLSRRRSAAARPAPAAVRSGARTVQLAPGALERLEDRRLLSVSASWDLATNTGSGPTNFGGRTFDDAHAPLLLLDLGSGMAEVQSFSWGVTNLGSTTSGGGTGAGRADLGDLNVFGDLGPAAVGVFRAISSGRHLPRVVLEGRDTEGGDVQFRYTLDDVLITSYQTGASAGAIDAPSDSVSLDFAAITFQQFEYDDKAVVETHTAKWSGAANTGSGPIDFGGESFAKGGEPPLSIDFGPGSIQPLSFSWGATQTGSTSGGGGGGGGRVNFGDVSLMSAAGDASPSLMFATASGRHIPEVVLDSHDSNGNRVRYTLEDVLVTSFQTSGAAGAGAPNDSFSLNFASIEVEQFQAPDRPGAPTPLPVVEWDLRANVGSGPTTFGGETFSKGAEPEFLLDLGTGMVELEAWSWGGSNPGSTGTGGGGGGTGVVNFGDFSFSAAPSAASPALIYAVASGRHLPEATLVVRTRNAPRHVDARYTLEDVLVTSYQANGSGNGTHSESFSFDFGSVALEQTHYTAAGAPNGTRDFSWDPRTNTGTGTAAFDTHTLERGATGLVLKLGNYELGAQAFSFGVSNPTAVTAGGTGVGRANFSGMSFVAELGEVTPNVLFAMSSGSHVPRAVLQQRDDDGNVVFEYVLEDVTVSSFSTAGTPGGDAPDSFSLDFDSVELTHTTRDQHGGATGTKTVSWDLQANAGDGDDDFAGTAPDEPLPPNRLLIDGEALGVYSFSWGASNPAAIGTGGGGGGAGKVNFSDLSFQLPSGAATPSWLLATATGARRPEVVFESRNADGDVYLRYTLTDVGVSSLQTSGASDVPMDSVSLNFAGIALEQINPGATQTTDWNVKTNTGHGQASFGDQVFPARDEPPLVLQIAGDELAPFSYSIGASHPAPIFGGGGGGGGRVSFSELNLSGLAGTGTAGLLYSVAGGRHIPQVVLEVRDGDLSRTITLEDVLVTSHQLSSGGDATTFESYSLAFRAITFTTADGGTPAPLEVSITGPAGGPEGSPLHLSGAAAPVGGGDAGELDFEWAVTRNGASVASGSGAAIDFTPADDGTYVLTLSASAASGATGTASRSIVVTNVAPTLSLFGSATVNERTPYSITFSATDPGADTISTWTVDWGDGTAVSLLPGTATSAGHQYATGGQTYVITLTATDEDGSYSLTRGVSVLTPKQAVDALAEQLSAQAGTLGGGNANALQSKLDAAAKSLATNKKSAAGQLGAFINQLEAWSGKKLPASVAATLIAQARAILALL